MALLQQDGTFYSAIGGQFDCTGSAIMYSTKDFTSWSFEGLLASQLGVEPASECSAAANGQNCDPVGKGCRTWECPDYFSVPGLDGAYVLKWSDQVKLAWGFALQIHYLLVAAESPLYAASWDFFCLFTFLSSV